MNSQEVSLSPCPECRGSRALFQVAGVDNSFGIVVNQWKGSGRANLYACVCLACGATTLRPAPEKMEEIRQLAQTQKPFNLK